MTTYAIYHTRIQEYMPELREFFVPYACHSEDGTLCLAGLYLVPAEGCSFARIC
jgi:hypothetical protein